MNVGREVQAGGRFLSEATLRKSPSSAQVTTSDQLRLLILTACHLGAAAARNRRVDAAA